MTEEFEPTIEAESVSEVAAEAPSQLIAQIEKRPEVAESQPEIEALAGRLPESDYEGGTTEDELNEAVGSANYASKMDVSCRHDSSSSTTSGQGTAVLRERSKLFVTTYVTDSFPSTPPRHS